MANQYTVAFAICAGFMYGEIVTDDDLGGSANATALVAINAIIPIYAPEVTDAIEATTEPTAPIGAETIPDASNTSLPSADP